jgi:hypothetical protein
MASIIPAARACKNRDEPTAQSAVDNLVKDGCLACAALPVEQNHAAFVLAVESGLNKIKLFLAAEKHFRRLDRVADDVRVRLNRSKAGQSERRSRASWSQKEVG